VTTRLIARSVSRPLRERLGRAPLAARVLAVFDRACDLVTPAGEVVALVTPDVGNGPLNVVVQAEAGCFAETLPGMHARLDREQLEIGGLLVVLGAARTWEPRPDWDALRTRSDVIAGRLPALSALALRDAAADSLMMLLQDPCAPVGGFSREVRAAARDGSAPLRAGWPGDKERAREGAVALAGLGGGLTPAGDDFLAGAMLWTWLAHPMPHSFCRMLAEASAPHTTILSAAFLRAAARGQCSAPWHHLLQALAQGAEQQQDTSRLEPAVREVLAHGATSGADALAGFLSLGTAGGDRAA
jgi:hypothetical protein